MPREIATLAGGCFWCLEAVFRELEGIEEVLPGYCGGDIADPAYEQVCAGNTGHAEAVQLIYNPQVILFRDILNIFFTIHDPTTLNRQGADIGTQYRSAIFYHDELQKTEAIDAIKAINSSGIWPGTVVTEIVPFQAFYPAEKYRCNYFACNRFQPYCQAIIQPKVLKFRQQYAARLKKE